ncbi:MAG: ABC transporter ATP-binding protein [Anaerolineaceae bacterium]|nr:ABC transporter ATP-binding protein [Anaerolineaceae bacterium]
MGFGFYGWWSYLESDNQKPKVTWDLIKRVLRYARPYRGHIAGMLTFILINTGLTLLTPLILRDLIDRTIPTGDVNRLVLLALGLLLIPSLGAVINVFGRRWNSMVGEGVIYDLRSALYGHLQRMSLYFYTNTRVGELMSRLNNDVIGAQNAINTSFVSIITNIIQAAAVLAVMLSLEWRLTLLSVLILPLFILAARRMGARFRSISMKQMEANAQMNAMMNETLNIGGMLLVKLFSRRQTEVERFNSRAAQVRDRGVQQAVLGSLFFVIIGLISAVGTALVYGVGGYFTIRHVFTVGTIVAFGAYLTSLYSSLQGLANAPVDFATSLVSFERVFEVIDLPLDIKDDPDAVEMKRAAGQLSFEEVSFRYELKERSLLSHVARDEDIDTETPVLSGKPQSADGDEDDDSEARLQAEIRSQARSQALDNISFTIQPGQLAALVGPSGAGKTTLTYLIPRLYDPTGGRILLDGHDLRSLTLDSLTAQIGMVTQETYLFHDSICTNLMYARPDASQAEVESAAKAANIHDFIMDLPERYDTIVGERGYRLSGGEKQRVALARVILKDPRILVLDEATSSLDSESEALIQDALKRVMAGRTSIVIAHRLSTILAADLILVMDRGQIIERGRHRDLLDQDGLYAHLYYTQFRNHNGDGVSSSTSGSQSMP